jgi:hypothetical protein
MHTFRFKIDGSDVAKWKRKIHVRKNQPCMIRMTDNMVDELIKMFPYFKNTFPIRCMYNNDLLFVECIGTKRDEDKFYKFLRFNI